MKILVTGGAGYIGSHTCKYLASAGHVPVVFDDLSQGHEWAVKWGPFERGSLNDPARLDDVLARHKVDAVVHFAASALVGESMTHPGKYFRNNALGTFTLLEAMRAAGVDTIVFSSTCATYGDPVRIPLSLQSTVAEIMAHPVAGPLVAEALPATGGGILGAAAGDRGDGDGALGIDREGLAKMMGSMPIGRVAMFPGSPVTVERIEQLIGAANAPQS